MIRWFNGNYFTEVNDKSYKPPKSVVDQILYLENHKKVVYNELNTVDGGDLLLKRNYINLITPFKHEFARPIEGKEYESERDENGSHIYDDFTDLTLYSYAYEDERSMYSVYYDGILKFESAFKSIVGHYFLTRYKIQTLRRAYDSFEILINKVDSLKFNNSSGEEASNVRRRQMKKSLYKLRNRLKDNVFSDKTVAGQDIYILLDRAGLPDVLNMYLTFKGIDKKKIFEQMQKWELNLNADDHNEFGEKVFNLGAIRNCIMHFNSITILLKYTDDSKKEIRGVSSRDDYKAVLESLKYIHKNCDI